MSELPTGTVTFLFTDIEGSTQLLKRLGGEYAVVLAEHQRLIRDACREHGGREIDTQGDSFFFAFPRAKAALGAAVVAQRSLAHHAWPDGFAVRVRMGLHTGEPLVGEDRYVGIGVHRAARIGAAGHGGQVLLSNATRELLEEEVGDVSIRHLGLFRLKDIDRPERLYQVDIADLQTEFPPVKAEKLAEPRSIRRRTLLIPALAAVIAAAVAIPIFAIAQGGSDGGTIDAAAGNSVALVSPESNRIVADVEVGTSPSNVAIGGDAVWATNSASGTVDRIDTKTNTVRQTVRVGSGPDGIAVGEGSVWVTNGLDGTVSRIDPRSSFVTQTIPVGNGPSGIATGNGSVWVVNRDDHTVARIDPDAGTVAGRAQVSGVPVEIAVASNGVWVTDQADGKVLRLDTRSGSVVETVSVGRGPGAIAATRDAVWVANSLDGTVSRIDAQTAAVVATVSVGDAPSGVAVSENAIWVSNEQSGTITRIDPVTNQVAKTVPIGASPVGLAIGPGGLFVATRPTGAAHRGGTLVMIDRTFFHQATLDPALTISPVIGLTNDGLTAFRRVGGRDGSQLVPNLALTLPEPTDGGKTYTFRLRKGVRYSTGAPVRAADFRRALERVFELGSYNTYLYESILGARSCTKRPKPKRCDLRRGIVADDTAGTVSFHLTAPDPELPAKLALRPAVAVPHGTPGRDAGPRGLPATGAYQVASFAPKRQVRLVRNPHFREWSHAARPAGYADEIVIRIGGEPAAHIRAVTRGDADVTDLSNIGLPQVAELAARFGSRLHSLPGPFGVYTFLNTRIPPFSDVRARKALSYALDRDAVVRDAGGSLFASPSCQILPVNYPGYRPYCPHRGDLAEAKRLVAASGTRGATVVVWTRASYEPFYAHVAEALRSLGYRARLRVVKDKSYFEALEQADPKTVHASYGGWFTEYPSAGEHITSLYTGAIEPTTGFSDPAIDRAMEQARALQQQDPNGANDAWAKIDRMLTDRAVAIGMYNLRPLVYVSERVGNFQYHPIWFTLLDQLWVR